MWMFVVALHTVSQEPGVFHIDSLLPPWGPQSPLTSNQELGKEHTGSHMGGFHGPDLEIVSITFIHVPLAGIVTWSHLTSREAGKYN